MLFIPIGFAIEGNFFITGGEGNGTNATMDANFYAVYGVNFGMDVGYSFGIIDDTPVITIVYPRNGTTITKTSPIELELTYTSPLGSTADIIFYSVTNESLLCSNTSIASGSTVKCPVTLNYGESMTWYVNATNSYADAESGLLTFFVKALQDTGYFAVLILLPVLFGFFIIIGTISMAKEHDVLKFAALPLSLITVLASMHFGSLVVNNINPSMTELQTQLGTTVTWMGWMIIVIFIYILMYMFYKLVQRIGKQKEENMDY